MPVDLEPPCGADTDWSVLYRARADEVEPHRPAFTGDVYTGVVLESASGSKKPRTVMVIQHPCAMRTNGYDLAPRLLVAEVRRHRVLEPREWVGFGKLMPLPGLHQGAESSGRHQAAFFDSLHLADREQLVDRVACLSQRGVNLLLQRWVHHNSRVVVPTHKYNEATASVFEEADLVEEWCFQRDADGVPAPDATAECVGWLREDGGAGVMRQRMLDDDQTRSTVRRQMREALRKPYQSPA